MYFPRHFPCFLALTSAAGLAVSLLSGCDRTASTSNVEIEVLCAVAMRSPLEEAARAFEAEGLGKVKFQFGGSQAMLATLEVSGQGDIFLPADVSYIETAAKKGLTSETVSLAGMTAVVTVAKGNPRGVHTLADLQKPDVRLVLANPELAAISKLTSESLPADTWQALKARATAMKPTVNDAANDVVLGAADAAIVWDVTVRQTTGLEAVTIPELNSIRGQASAAVTAASRQPAQALKFLRWLAAPEKGAITFQKNGYKTAAGSDAWDEKPVLTLMSGAMLRPAIEPALEEFEKREGCRVERVYNGCGILVGQMKAAAPGDLFFACDASFMAQMEDVFPGSVEVSTNQLVILVPKGNPRGIRTLEDLGKEGLKVGIGHEKQCALGVITQTTLTQSGWRDAVMKNVVVQAPAGDLLVNQVLAGGIDAAVTYVSNAAGAPDKLDAFGVALPCAIATQPLGIAKNTKFPQLAIRLRESLRSAKSRTRFEALGFGWHVTD
jgi:molybdate transport system substrate-binding protein